MRHIASGHVFPHIAWINVAEGSFRKTTMLINHSIGIMRCGRVFRMQTTDHHTLVTVLPRHVRILAEKTRITTQELDTDVKKEKRSHKSLSQHTASMRDNTNSNRTHGSCHASSLHLRAHSAAGLGEMAGKRKTGDKEAAGWLCCVLLGGMSCSDSK